MPVLRGALLHLANQRAVYHFAMQHDLLRGIAWRYVAGETLDAGLRAARALGARGLRIALDHLGESVTTEAEAQAAADACVRAVEAVADPDLGADTYVSLKLTSMGLDVSRDACLGNLRRVLDRARDLGGIFVRLDMEGSAYTARTLDLHEELWRAGYRNVGVVLQSYLYRTADDVEREIRLGARVRLCKGAYLEGADVAYPAKRDVDRSYARCAERLLLAGHQPAIATHDERLIRHTRDIAREHRVGPERFEFQMLYGVRRDLQDALVRQGYNVRVYVPYGAQWYPYLMRRLAERPANLAFFAGALLREARAPARRAA